MLDEPAAAALLSGLTRHRRLLVLTAVFIAIYVHYRGERLSDIYLSPARVELAFPDPCQKRARCVLVLLPGPATTPETLNLVRTLKHRWHMSRRIGLKIVVDGNDDSVVQSNDELMSDAYLDPRHLFAKRLKVKTPPAWLVMDENRRLLKRFEGDDSLAFEGIEVKRVIQRLDLDYFDVRTGRPAVDPLTNTFDSP